MYSDESQAPIVLLPPSDDDTWVRARNDPSFEITGSVMRDLFREFFRNFHVGSAFIYRDSLIRQWHRNEYFVEIDLAHLNEFSEILFNAIQTRPDETLQYFGLGAKDALQRFLVEQSSTVVQSSSTPDIQIVLKSAQLPESLRSLTAEHVNKLIKVPGIVISCTKIRAKATVVVVKCSKCGSVKRLPCKSVFGGVQIPSKCDRDGQGGEPCGKDTFSVMADNCEYIDQQTLKLQESPEVVPTGEMPRNIMLSVDRYLVDRVTPGTRVSVMGIFSLTSSSNPKAGGKAIKTSYLRVVGIEIGTNGGGRMSSNFSPQEEEAMQRLARDPDIYNKIARSIAPQISGEYTVDIKKALACLLMGGSRKVLGDGMRLRGDINVLLMGDPSTAKSQFLKFIERVSPIGVYTSGKGSSAAGLTASVIRDARGEFYLEGGAMVLADGGVICIDEVTQQQ